jgi:hypothetical protein
VILAIIWFLYKVTGKSSIRNHFIIGLIVKILAGIGLGILYFRFYEFGDTLVFNMAANAIVDLYGSSFKDFTGFLFGKSTETLVNMYPVLDEPRSAFFIKILSIFYVFTSNNYWITSIYFSLISFMGSWFLANIFIKKNHRLKYPALLAFLYFPTFVFWTSGIMKESIAWFCLATLISFTIIILDQRKLTILQVISYLMVLLVLWSIKYHYAAVFILCSSPIVIYSLFLKKYQRKVPYIFAAAGAFILISILLMISHPNLYPDQIFTVILENHAFIKQISEPGHSIKYIPKDDPYVHFFINIPVALIGGLFMPLLWQGTNVLSYTTGLVNTIILLLFVVKVISLSLSRKRSITFSEISFGLYIIILAVLMAYTTPNFGTLERYKTSYIAFFVLWILYDNPTVSRIFGYPAH